MKTVRIYGRTINTWTTKKIVIWRGQEKEREILVQKEVEYKEYDSETGKLSATGSEDFTPERWKSEVAEHWVFTWDGEKRNKGGYRWFEDRGKYIYRKSGKKALEQLIKTKCNDVKMVQFRK